MSRANADLAHRIPAFDAEQLDSTAAGCSGPRLTLIPGCDMHGR